MCGIFGYVGKRELVKEGLEGIGHILYRGKDSCGLAIEMQNDIVEVKALNSQYLQHESIWSVCPEKEQGDVIIGHTRQATHGEVSARNAHPHHDCSGKLFLVHNGMIWGDASYRESLEKRGHIFTSTTDTEVLVHYIEEAEKELKDLAKAVAVGMYEVSGSFAILVMHSDYPGVLVGAKHNNPLVIGIGENEYWAGSDIDILRGKTKKFCPLENDTVVCLTTEGGYTIPLLNVPSYNGGVNTLHYFL